MKIIQRSPVVFSVVIILFSFLSLSAQTNPVSKIWVADGGDGTYKNPILHADYSDPDAVRVGNDFYMTASSFNAAPGLPILHSKDLVWQGRVRAAGGRRNANRRDESFRAGASRLPRRSCRLYRNL